MGFSLKKLTKAVGKAAGAVASTATSVASAGTVSYNANTGGIKVNTKAEDIGTNFLSGITGGAYLDAAMGGPAAMEAMPVATPIAEQEKEAEKVAETKVEEQVKPKSSGLSATILGGSVNTDSTVLKKRKLLGE